MKKLLVALLVMLSPLCAKADYFGDFVLGDTISMLYNTYKSTDGSDLQRTAAGTVACHQDGATTDITSGVSDSGTTAFNSNTGSNKITVIATVGNGFAAGHDYVCGWRSATLNTVTDSFINAVSFSIENRTGTRGSIKDRGNLSTGSSTTLIQLGAKLSSSNIWNGMTFYDLSTNEKAAICATTDNGSTDTLSVLGLVTTPGSTDAYQIINNGPLSCINLPKVDANGHVYVGYMGTSGSGEPSISDKAGTNFNFFYDNGNSLATLLTIGGLYNYVSTIWTTSIDGRSTGCWMATMGSVMEGPSTISGLTANYKDPSNTVNRVAGTYNAAGERPASPTVSCPGGF